MAWQPTMAATCHGPWHICPSLHRRSSSLLNRSVVGSRCLRRHGICPVQQPGSRACTAAASSSSSSTAEADLRTRGRRREDEPKEAPVWLPWDDKARQQQAAALAELQACARPPLHACMHACNLRDRSPCLLRLSITLCCVCMRLAFRLQVPFSLCLQLERAQRQPDERRRQKRAGSRGNFAGEFEKAVNSPEFESVLLGEG